MRHSIRYWMLALSLVCASYSVSFAQSARAMWVWQSDSIISNLNGAEARLFSFCASPPGASETNRITSNVINTLYFYCHSYIHGDSAHRAQLHRFLSDAHAQNLTVHFLDGNSDWATTGRTYGENYIDYLLQFNAESNSSSGRFDGLQLDVEPYLLPGWFTQSVWDGFMLLLSDARSKIAQSHQTLSFGVAAPRWYESNPGPSYLLQLQKSCDYLAVMDYVDNETSLKADVSTEIHNADSLGKKVVVGVETIALSPTSSSFNEEGWGNLEARLYEVSKYYRLRTSYAGTAIHDYQHYARLSKWGSNNVDATAPSTISYRYDADDANGTFAIQIKDDMSGAINATASIATVSARKNTGSTTTTVAGNWNSTSSNTLTFCPTVSVDSGGLYSLTYSPKDISGNVRMDTVTLLIAATPYTVAPSYNAMSVAKCPTICWRAALGASSYRLQVATTTDFSQMVYDQANLTDTTQQLSGLSDSTLYYWRVSASNGLSTSRYSNRQQFTTTGSWGPIFRRTQETGSSQLLVQAGVVAGHVATIRYQLEQPQAVTIEVYDLTGRIVKSVSSNFESVGSRESTCDLSEFKSGTYVVKVATAGSTESKEIHVIR